MKKLIRRFVRWALYTSASFLAIILLYVAVLAFPQPLFAYTSQHENLTLYSDTKIEDDLDSVLEDIYNRLSSIEVNNPQTKQRIFICNSKKLYSFFTHLVRTSSEASGFSLALFRNVFIYPTRIKDIFNENTYNLKHSFMAGETAGVITHEIAHNLTSEAVGYLNYWNLPSWKTEGYAEYAANIHSIRQDDDYDFAGRVKLAFNDEFWSCQLRKKHYYLSQIMIEYLSEVKGLKFSEIMNEKVTKSETLADLKAWFKADTYHP